MHLVGCGGRGAVGDYLGGPCEPGKTVCLSQQVGQICNAQGQWATFQCGDNRICAQGMCVSDGSECIKGTHECASTSLVRICRIDGSGWETNQCPDGTSCESGVCLGSCEPGTTSCVDNQMFWQCDAELAGYVMRECPASMSCSNGACASNTAASCSFGQDVCLDEKTALVCMHDGSGYDVKDCPSATTCQAGKCWGPVCAAGVTACASTGAADFTGIQTCNGDGSGYDVTICNDAGRCVQNKDTGQYECYVPPCTSGAEVCGDPTTADESSNQVSRCETLANGKLGWVGYRCDSPASCVATSTTAAACHAECSPGDQRCSADGTATETCSSNGVWVASPCAKTGNVQDMCVQIPGTKQFTCGDKDCRTLATSVTTYASRGRCRSTYISLCGDDGRLGTASACEEGQCIVESDGFGTCKDPTRCNHDDGWSECVASADSFRTCLSGHWEFTLCAEGELCSNAGDGYAVCGNSCVPGRIRCVDADYQVCADDGTWVAIEHCGTGECNPLSNRCEPACSPDQLRCSGDIAVAPDGSSLGSRSVQGCTSGGAWGTPVTCTGSTLCRRSGMGKHLGCVQCVGPQVTGGNEEGAVDSRCNADASGFQTCQADNTWPAQDTACTGTEHCVKQRDGAITGVCSNYGCSATSTRSRVCVGYETVSTPVTIDDCCDGQCDTSTGACLHRRRQFDPSCTDTTSCSTGRVDPNGIAIVETCCNGYCKSGQGCLKVKAEACSKVTTCNITKVDHSTVCCGTCLTSGLCSTGTDAQHPVGEYFTCGSSTNICWSIGNCSLQPSGSTSGAMFANCVE